MLERDMKNCRCTDVFVQERNSGRTGRKPVRVVSSLQFSSDRTAFVVPELRNGPGRGGPQGSAGPGRLCAL